MDFCFAMKFLQRMRRLTIERRINQTYAKRLAAKGSQPEGVFWNSEANQTNRFVTLLALIDTVTIDRPMAGKAGYPVSIAEIGCGYGALYRYLQQRDAPERWRYHGVDINPTMIAACRRNFPKEIVHFKVADRPQHEVDFSVFSGTYNLTPVEDCEQWLGYILQGLQNCWTLSRRGMVLNFLCAPEAKISKKIYYTNRQDFITAATRHFGPTIAVPTKDVAGDFSFLISRGP